MVEPIKPYQVKTWEIMMKRRPSMAPYIYSAYGVYFIRYYEGKENLTSEEQYHYEQSKLTTEFKDVSRSLRQVKGMGPMEPVYFQGESTPVRRDIAISRLETSKKSLSDLQTKLLQYHREGYRIEKDPSGQFVVYKPVTVRSTQTIGSEDQLLAEARKSYQEAPWYEKAARGFFTGATQWPKLIYFTGGEIISRGASPVDMSKFGTAITVGLGKFQKDIIQTEYKGWKQLKSGDKTGWVVEHVIKSPAISDIVIPFSVGAIAAPISGSISKMGSGAIKITGWGAKSVQRTASIYPYVTGGIFTGMAAGGITGTLALEQKGLVPKGSTVHTGLKTGVQFGSAFAGYSIGSQIKPVSFKQIKT